MLDGIVIPIKNYICCFRERTGRRFVNRHHLKDLRDPRHLKHLQQPQIHDQVVDLVFFVNKSSDCIAALDKT